MAEFSDDLLIARPLPNGYTWTLASRLSALLNEVEQRFGSRDHLFTIVGIEFREGGVPQCWFPGNRKHVVIQLSTSCLADVRRSVFQLAHECVHLLNPVLSGTASVLEEGLATLFSLQQTEALFGSRYPVGDAAYERAAQLVGPLLRADAGAIQRLRSDGKSLSAVTAADVRNVYPDLPDDHVDELCQRFGPERNVA